MRRRFEYKDMELEDFLIRFYPAGNYTWVVPKGCFSLAQGDQQTDPVKEAEVMAAEEAASDTLWFMPEPAVMALC